MEWYIFLLLIIVGLASGFINTIAGSGSLLTIPVLLFLGLDINIANGTLRIGILTQSITAVSSFKQQKVFEWKEGFFLAAPAVLGSIIGAYSAINLNSKTMEIFIGGLFIFMLFLLLFKPEKWINGQAGKIKSKPSILQLFIFFLIGLYGGFIQIGVGFFLLSGLVLVSGFELVKANAIKSFIVLAYTPFALGVFILNNQVNYKYGIILAIGNIIGAWLAAKITVKKGAKFIRLFLIVIILITASKLIFENIF